MNGMEMMVGALLKATGFSREQFDEGVSVGKQKLAEYDRRFAAMENDLTEIKRMLRTIVAPQSVQLIEVNEERNAHAADVDATRG